MSQSRCPVTRKYCYTTQNEALYAADRVALHNWRNGRDTEMNAYWCSHCLSYHVGTRQSRPIHPWKTPLHEYRFLPNPRPRVQPPVHAGNFIPQEKTYRRRAASSRHKERKTPWKNTYLTPEKP